MSEAVIRLFEKEGGEFVSPPSLFSDKLKNIRAILFDWDGVFNDGFKTGTEGSLFSEVDAMGTNLLRYALWKPNGELPVTAIITGEKNLAAQTLGHREHFHGVYLLSKNKTVVFNSFCEKHQLKPVEVLFFFDDVLDLDVARECGGRVMIGRKSSPMLQKFAKESSLVDYITGHGGNQHGLREGCELIVGLLGSYEEVVNNRMVFSKDYQAYLSHRNQIETVILEAAK